MLGGIENSSQMRQLCFSACTKKPFHHNNNNDNILNKNDKYIGIFTDSQAVLKALNKSKTKIRTILKTKTALNELGKSVQSLTIKWTKAHVGHEGNELADMYANLAFSGHFVRRWPYQGAKFAKNLD